MQPRSKVVPAALPPPPLPLPVVLVAVVAQVVMVVPAARAALVGWLPFTMLAMPRLTPQVV